MINTDFIKGFKQELNNRSFSLLVAERLSERTKGSQENIFWKAYLKLEQFNLIHYRIISKKWQLDTNPSLWIKFKACTVSSIPKPLLNHAIQSALSKTKAYVHTLLKLREIGPKSDVKFLDYMVAQEKLQVKIMLLALTNKHDQTLILVDNFIDQYEQ